MKRILMIALLALSAVSLIFAQGIEDSRAQSSRPEQRQRPEFTPEKTSVTGNLTIASGMAAIKSNDATYLIPGLIQYAGFIEGVKDGAQVTIEGISAPRRADVKTVMLMPTKLIIGNKEYELGRPFAGAMMQNRNMPMQNRNMPMQNRNRGTFQRQPGSCPCNQPMQRQFPRRDNNKKQPD